jgi:hypothetical protein
MNRNLLSRIVVIVAFALTPIEASARQSQSADDPLVPFPVSQFRTVHIFRLLSSEYDDTISILQH